MLVARVAVAVTSIQHPTSNICSLPTRLNDARNLSLERQLAKTDAAQIKFPQIAAGPATPFAPCVRAHRKFRFSLRFRN